MRRAFHREAFLQLFLEVASLDQNLDDISCLPRKRDIQKCQAGEQDHDTLPKTSKFQSRLSGPGTLYNIGNILALLSGILVQVASAWDQSNIGTAVYLHLMGSPGALWLTGSMLVFLIAGEFYHRAWQGTHLADPRLVQMGDLFSAVAAMALTVALVWLGDTAIALLAGVLLAGGKLGAAILPTFNFSQAAQTERALRIIVVISRAPSITALAFTIAQGLQKGNMLEEVVLPSAMIVCFLLWLWADLLLLRMGQVVLIDRANLRR